MLAMYFSLIFWVISWVLNALRELYKIRVFFENSFKSCFTTKPWISSNNKSTLLKISWLSALYTVSNSGNKDDIAKILSMYIKKEGFDRYSPLDEDWLLSDFFIFSSSKFIFSLSKLEEISPKSKWSANICEFLM